MARKQGWGSAWAMAGVALLGLVLAAKVVHDAEPKVHGMTEAERRTCFDVLRREMLGSSDGDAIRDRVARDLGITPSTLDAIQQEGIEARWWADGSRP